MSISVAFKQSLTARSPQDRLSRVLKENKNRFNINNDGFINMNLENVDVQAEIVKQLDKLENIGLLVTKTPAK
ncbi:multidrug ABC transporter ATPase [Serratia fonticola]|uniref:multidrug ABC transporter ATPase n=1 Tax=Serratia fonticola TaxID=47917 RepID=UPI003AAA6DB6